LEQVQLKVLVELQGVEQQMLVREWSMVAAVATVRSKMARHLLSSLGAAVELEEIQVHTTAEAGAEPQVQRELQAEPPAAERELILVAVAELRVSVEDPRLVLRAHNILGEMVVKETVQVEEAPVVVDTGAVAAPAAVPMLVEGAVVAALFFQTRQSLPVS
jgi:hypothetical protein